MVGRPAVVDRGAGVVMGDDGSVYVPMVSSRASIFGAMDPLAEVKLSGASTGP